MIKVEIVADSISEFGARISTFLLTYPRFMHSEFMTHRVFSRNASSSRAIPVSKQIQEIIDNPAIPLAFTKNQKGMQGGEALTGESHNEAVKVWLEARNAAVTRANALADLEVHKQYANRILEPFAHITVVCTSTEWDNFFALRRHEAALPEIRKLADEVYGKLQVSTPVILERGDWHLPFVSSSKSKDDIFKSVARCARVSYKNHDGSNTTDEQDQKLHDFLLEQRPIHASPAEHQATPLYNVKGVSGNFVGWIQYRKLKE